MSHIDEGALHAYLDGALDEYPVADAVRIREHLDSCAECAERLEVERAIRMDAHAILGLAAPEVEVPSFEELRAYVERTRPKGRAISVYAYRMRLAASVVLALGTGWMLRGGLPGESAPEARAVTQADATEAVVQGAPALSQPEVVASASSGGAAGGIGSSEEARVSEAPQSVATRADLPDQLVAARQEIGAARSAGAEIRSMPEAEMRSAAEADVFVAAEPPPVEAEKQSAVTDVEVTVAAAVAAPATAGLAAESATATDDAPEDGAPLDFARFADEVAITAAIDETVAPASTDAAPSEPGEPTSVSTEREESSSSRDRSAGAPVTSALEQNSFAARRAVSDEDVAISDEPSMAVPGLEVVTVTSLGQGTAPSGTHVVQRMEDGSIIEIYHLLPEVEPDIVPAAAPGLNEVRALTEGGWIVLQGPVPAEELQTLLESLFPTG